MADKLDSEEKIEASTIEEEQLDSSATSETVDKPKQKISSKRKKDKKTSESDLLLEEANAEVRESQERFLRLRAEYDNFRKRSQAEKAATYSNAFADAIMAILPVADNMDRALGQDDASGKDLYKGLQMISNQFLTTFEQLNVKQIGKKGELFDPNLHNAVSHIKIDAVEEGVITEVLQKGYMIGDKVIRYAMVQVAN